MRILLLTHYYYPEVGAAQTRLLSLTKALVKMGHEVEIVCPLPNYPEGRVFQDFRGRFSQHEESEGGRVRIHRYWLWASTGKGVGRLLSYLSFCLTSLFCVLHVRKPDLIFVNSGPLFLAQPGACLARIYRRPWVLNVSDLWPRSVEMISGLGGRLFLKWGLALEKWAYRDANYLNAITDGVRDILLGEKRVPAEKVLFLPNGVDLSFFGQARGRGMREQLGLQGKTVFIYPGNHGYAHALEYVLQTAKAIENIPALSSVHFLLVGGGSEKPSLVEQARTMGLRNLTLADPVPFSVLAQWIEQADIGLVHVRDTALASETRPAKMFPLMAGCKPVLYIGQGEGVRLLQASGGGWSTPSGDVQGFVRALEKVVVERAQWELMGQRNRRYVEENFSAEQLVTKWWQELHRKLWHKS